MSLAGTISAGALVESITHARQVENTEGADPLVVIVGPTASEKSALALHLAGRFGGEVVNYDSVQVYRGFDIGSGKLTPQERKGIAHHLLDVADPAEVFTAGDFSREATKVLARLRESGKLPILAGGTGLYLRSLLVGLFEGPPRSEKLRARLKDMAERRGREFLHRMLQRLDPVSASRIQPRDTQKIIRALEVRCIGRQPISTLQAAGRKGLKGFRSFKIGLNPNRSDLNRRIDARVERMFRDGLVKETRRILENQGVKATEAGRVAPLGALGYRQACAVLAGQMSEPKAIRDTQTATRQYAKRQMTWFRREDGVQWFEGFGDDPEILRRMTLWLCEAGGLSASRHAKPPRPLPMKG